MLEKLICLVVGHSATRHRVKFDGAEYRVKCSRCGAPLAIDTPTADIADAQPTRESNEIERDVD